MLIIMFLINYYDYYDLCISSAVVSLNQAVNYRRIFPPRASCLSPTHANANGATITKNLYRIFLSPAKRGIASSLLDCPISSKSLSAETVKGRMRTTQRKWAEKKDFALAKYFFKDRKILMACCIKHIFFFLARLFLEKIIRNME